MAIKIHTIITHTRPHIDEIFAIWLLRKFGEAMFPGISTAKIEYRSINIGLLDDKTAKQWVEEGILLLGIGKGRFDEHPGIGTTEKRGNCCATLIAKALDVYSDIVLKDLIDFVFNDDTDAVPEERSPFDLGALVVVRNKNNKISPEEVLEMTFSDIDCFYLKSLECLSIDKESINAFEEMIKGPKDKRYKLVIIKDCNNEHIGNFSRSAGGYKADITVSRRTNGHVNISVKGKSGLNLQDVSKILNHLENRNGNGRVKIDNEELTKNGAIKDGRWFYHKGLNMLLNGGPSAHDVEPTKLSLNGIKVAIRTAMNPDTFDGYNTQKCKEGVCIGKKCILYNYGLNRCKTIWRKAREEKEKEVQCV